MFLTFFFSLFWSLSHNAPTSISDELCPCSTGSNDTFKHIVWAPVFNSIKFNFFSIFLTFFLVFPNHSHMMMHLLPSPTSYIYVLQVQTIHLNTLFGPWYVFFYVSDKFLTFFFQVSPGHSHTMHVSRNDSD